MIYNYLFRYTGAVLDVLKSSLFGLYLFFYEPVALWFVKIGLPIVTELQASLVLDKYCQLKCFPSEYDEVFRNEIALLSLALEKWYGGEF